MVHQLYGPKHVKARSGVFPRFYQGMSTAPVPNRHERRKVYALANKKNTVGVPLGYNQRTWSEHCAKK